MPIRITAAALILLAGQAPGGTDWPREIDSPGGIIRIYSPQIESYQGTSMGAQAAVSFTAPDAAEPVFGAVWLDCLVQTDKSAGTVTLSGVKVTQIQFPEGKGVDPKPVASAVEEQMPRLNISFPLKDILEELGTAQKEKETSKEIEVAPPQIITREHPAVLVLLDGEPVYIDVEGTSLRRVANTPFFLVQNTGSGTLFLKGGDIWYTAREITGPWEATKAPPREALDLALKSQTETQAAEMPAPDAPAEKSGSVPEVIVSTVPAELIATNGPVQFSPIKETGLLYASNTPSKLFLSIQSQDYYILISGRWYTARTLSGPWAYVASTRLPVDFARIPPGSPRDDVLASVAGTVPAKEAVLNAQIPQTAEVDRTKASTQVQYDGAPAFEPIENTGMSYASNASTAVVRVGDRFYNCDRGVWFDGPTPNGPWEVCVSVPPPIYTIPPRYPVYYVRYVRVYGYTPNVVYVGYTPGYTGSYVYGGTVVYGTGYYYRPWFRHYYYPRPWTWGFGVHYDPWTGWSFGYASGWWRPRGWFAYNNWGVVRAGWWGPVGYRPVYRPVAGPVYREGYRPVYRPLVAGRAGSGPVFEGARSTGPVRTASLYDRWSTGVSRPGAGERPRQAVDMARPQGRPSPAARRGPNVRQGKGDRPGAFRKPARERQERKERKPEKDRDGR